MRRSTIFAALAFAAVGALTTAQQQATPTSAPQRVANITYNYLTGETKITPVAVGTQQTAVTCFDNGMLFFTGLFSPTTAGIEFMDWGIKSCLFTQLVSGATFGYGTTALDPGMGGPGPVFDVAIYTGTMEFGVPGTAVANISIPAGALPGSPDGISSFFGLVGVTFSPPLLLCDGAIGWGYTGFDGLTGPLLEVTTGVCGFTGNPVTGTQDCFDLYSPPGVGYLGTFSFAAPGISSFFLELDEENGSSSTAVTNNGGGGNPNVYTSPAAILSQPWTSTVALGGFPTADLTAITFAHLPGNFALIYGELLLTPPFVGPLDIALGTHTVTAPKDPGLIGVTIYVQAVIHDGTGFHLTNRIELGFGL